MQPHKLALPLLLASLAPSSSAARLSSRKLRDANSKKKTNERRLGFDEDFSMAAAVSEIVDAPSSSSGIDPQLAAMKQTQPSNPSISTPQDKQKVEDKLCTGPLGRLYGFETQNDQFGYIQLPAADPVSFSPLSSVIGDIYAGASGLPGDDFIYQINGLTGTFVKLSKVTGSVVETLPTVSFSGDTIDGLEMDLTTGKLYGVSSIFGTTGYLQEINPSTGHVTLIAPLPNVRCPNSFAIDGHGNGFILDSCDDDLHSVNLETGVTSVIGPVGFNANFAQGMGYNPDDDTIYMAAYNVDVANVADRAQLRSVDTTTGATTYVATIGGSTQVTYAAFETCGFHGGWASIWSTLEYLANKVFNYGS